MLTNSACCGGMQRDAPSPPKTKGNSTLFNAWMERVMLAAPIRLTSLYLPSSIA